jgi:glycosyltransferase involved in cell wall biosynthesis
MQTEANELSSSDIGIMPLKYTMFENGKCGFKLIQYMASGLPVVASALPANKEIVQDGSNGYIVTNETEWYDSRKTIIDTNLRSEFGAKGREIIETKYTYQVWGKNIQK